MSENAPHQVQDAATLHRLMPSLSGQQRVEDSVVHAGDRFRANSELRVGAHLARLTNLLQHEGVETRVWDSAVEELVIKPEDISDSYWDQQKQIARDNGLGDIQLGSREKVALTNQLQEAQRTGLTSWRDYLESTGDQYPVWFKFYAWDGMSRLGTFDKQKGIYGKRSNGTVAPYPQLNPAALSKVFEAVNDKGINDQTVAKLVKSGNFNKLYSHMLLDQKAVISTPEKPEDVRGEWKEYSSKDIQAITEAAEGTPWCIAGRSMAESYTRNGGKFLLFHLQDPETGKFSPTAAASVRLDGRGYVVELSGLKGGASQYLEDALVPTVQEKVKELPGGEKYLLAFEDKQMLIQMDRKFQNGEPFTREELLFLYETERPIRYIDTYAKDPRVEEFKRHRNQHLQQLSETEGIDIKEAELIVTSASELENNLTWFLGKGYNPNIVAYKLTPKARFKYLDMLTEAGAQVDLNELYNQFEATVQLSVFSKLQEKGADLDPNELSVKFSPLGQLKYFHALAGIGAVITPDGVVNALSDKERFDNLWELSKIGAKVDVDGLLKEFKPRLDTNRIALYLKEGAKLETIKEMFELDLSYRSRNLGDIARQLVEAGLSGDETMSFLASVKLKDGGFNSGGESYDRIQELLSVGIEPDAILRSHVFDSYHIEHEMAKLLSVGADTNEIINELSAYFTGKHIDDLIKAGAQITDIVSHIQAEPKYILIHLEQLNDNGANLDIENVVAAMDPKDVLCNLTLATKFGANIDVNDLLDSTKVVMVYARYIDEMLALGADPQKIANKISAVEVGYEHGHWESYSFTRTGKFIKKHPEIFKLVYERVRNEVATKAA